MEDFLRVGKLTVVIVCMVMQSYQVPPDYFAALAKKKAEEEEDNEDMSDAAGNVWNRSSTKKT